MKLRNFWSVGWSHAGGAPLGSTTGRVGWGWDRVGDPYMVGAGAGGGGLEGFCMAKGDGSGPGWG